MSNKGRTIWLLLALVLTVLALAWPLGDRAVPQRVESRVALDDLSPPMAAALDGPSAITGVVRSADSAPIAGARVCAACASCEPTGAPPSLCAQTGRDGRYALLPLAAAGYYVGAIADGYRPGSANGGKPVFLEPAERRDSVDLELSAGGAHLAGSVLDATGGSVPFARVRAVRLSPPRVSLDVEADEAGRFGFWLDPGPVSLIAHAPGYTQARATAVAPNRGIELRLVPAATIEGRVVAMRSGEPLPGVEVRAAPVGRPDSLMFPPTRTGDSGDFLLPGLAPGSYALTAKGERVLGRLPRAIDLEVADHLRDVVIAVAEAASVHGRVRIEGEDAPCREGLVALGDPNPLQPSATDEPARSNSGPEQVADIRPDGSVSFAGVPPGSYFVSVRCTGHRFHSGPTRLEVGRDSIDEVVWLVSSGAKLRVRVMDARGVPLADTPLFLRWPTVSPEQVPAVSAHRSDAAASFEIAGLAPGEYEVLPGLGRNAGDGVRVTLRDTDRLAEVTLTVPASGRILVDVRDEAGEPVQGLRVTAVEAPRAPSSTPARPRRSHGIELGEGRYRVGPVPAGEYRVIADDGLNPPSEALLRVDDGRATEHEFVLARSAELRGIVLDESGDPVADVWVSARAARPAGMPSRLGGVPQRVLTDREGHFSFSRIAANARYVVRATSAHGPTGNAAVRDDVDPREWLELRLQPSAAVSGVVVDTAGRAVPAYRLQVASAASDLQHSTEVADAAGHFALPDIAPGPVQLLAVSPAGEVATAELTLDPGQRKTDLRLTLLPAQ